MRAAHQGPASRRQFGRFEGLAQEIVGTQVQRLDLVGQGAAGGENESGQRFARAAQAPHQRQAVGARQPDIDHRQREFLVRDGGLCGFGTADAMHRVVRGRQTARDGIGDDVIIFYD